MTCNLLKLLEFGKIAVLVVNLLQAGLSRFALKRINNVVLSLFGLSKVS